MLNMNAPAHATLIGLFQAHAPLLSSEFCMFGWVGAPLTPPEVHFCIDIQSANERIEKLNKRARRLGVPEVGFKVVDEHEEYEYIGRDPLSPDKVYVEWAKSRYAPGLGLRSTGAVRTVFHCVLTGAEEVKLAGWTFLGVLDHELGENNTVVRMVPSAEGKLPSDWKHKNNFCDHCRRNQLRKQTFVISHEDGRLLQVGSTCIKDFLGHDVAATLGHVEIIALLREVFDDIDEGMGGYLKEPTVFRTVEYLAWVAKAIREGGWVSRAKARDNLTSATADDALSLMLEHRRQARNGL